MELRVKKKFICIQGWIDSSVMHEIVILENKLHLNMVTLGKRVIQVEEGGVANY